MKAFVYVLELENGQYYIGSTTDIERRLTDHINGHTKTTKRIKVGKLLFYREYESLEIARKIERYIKKQKSRRVIEKFMTDERKYMAP